MERTANARWEGDLKAGNGKIKTGSGSFEGKYSFGTRFENAAGTNPEELLGAAHAACYAMALSASLAKAGKTPKSVDTTATVKLEKVGEGFSITGIHLDVKADVPGIAAAEFQKFAEDTRKNCIVSRALASVPTTMKAALTT